MASKGEFLRWVQEKKAALTVATETGEQILIARGGNPVDYSIESDPYLSPSAKATLAEQKANGADLSLVEQFLWNTAPLMAPSKGPSPAPDYVVAAVCFALVALGLTGIIAAIVAAASMAQAIAIAFFVSLLVLPIAALCGGENAAINAWIGVTVLWMAAGLAALAAVALGIWS